MTTQELKLTEIGALKLKALSFPKSLHDARQRAFTAATLAKEIEGEIKDAETEELLTASIEQGADGKAKYTNDMQRKAAAAKALAESPVHRERLKRLAAAESDALNAKLDVQRIEDEHRSYQDCVRLVLGEVELLTAWTR